MTSMNPTTRSKSGTSVPARRRMAVALVAAALAVTVSGCGGDDAAVDTSDADLTFVATDFAYDPDTTTVAAGAVTIELDNQGNTPHNWLIEGQESATEVDTKAGEQIVETIDLEPGTYTFYCNVVGHREAGMEGTLTVE